MSNSKRRSRPQRIMAAALCWMLLCISSSDAFSQLHMKYEPPVQSSVSKMQRFGSNDKINSRASKRAAATYDVASPRDLASRNSAASFKERMRGLIFGKTEKKTTTRALPPNVCTVDTLEEYRTVVGEETSKVVAVRFHATYCKSCKAIQPLFYRLATKFPNVVFVDVAVTNKNTNLQQGLAVPSLPFGHIYHPTGGLVEEVRLTRKFVSHFARKLQSYVAGSCELQGVGDATSPYPGDDEVTAE